MLWRAQEFLMGLRIYVNQAILRCLRIRDVSIDNGRWPQFSEVYRRNSGAE